MEKRITKNGIDYVLVGDYYMPDLKLPEEERPIGKYGRMFSGSWILQECSVKKVDLIL